MIKSSHLILIGLTGLLFLWLTDAALDVFLFHEGTFSQQLLSPGTREIWMRSNLLVFLMAFLIFFTVYMRRREALSDALRLALAQAASEKARVEEAMASLATANQELKSFSYTVSHDVRKPLTIIYSAAQTLQEQLKEEQGDAGYLVQVICDASRRMDELIDALQILSHVSLGSVSQDVVDLSACSLEILADLHMMEPTRVVDWQVTPGLVALGDERCLRVLLENLIGNAWKYSCRSTPARIEFGEVMTACGRAFYVRDNGAGFDMDRINLLFRPFVRLHKVEEFPGTGIGLATVQRIVQRHGGQAWGEGAVGQGATFFFTLGQVLPGLADQDLSSVKEGPH